MKIKDIEKTLKSEHEKAKVPDMLSRVKKAPINKLLSGETPAQAFQKKLAVRLLTTTAILLVAAVFCFAAMLLFTENSEADPVCYISLRIQTEQGEEAYGIVVSGDVSRAVCVNETTREKTSYFSISALHALVSTDKVLIAAICEDGKLAADILASFREELSLAYPEMSVAAVTTSVNSPSEIAALSARVQALGGAPSDSPSELVDFYASLL